MPRWMSYLKRDGDGRVRVALPHLLGNHRSLVREPHADGGGQRALQEGVEAAAIAAAAASATGGLGGVEQRDDDSVRLFRAYHSPRVDHICPRQREGHREEERMSILFLKGSLGDFHI